MLVTHARWLDADGQFQEGSLLIRDGHTCFSAKPSDPGQVLDASGMLVLPGAIDSHTHLREPGQEHKEGIDSGTRAALAGGVTTLLDMPNNAPPICSGEQLSAKAALFRQKSRVNWGLYLQAPVSEGTLPRHAAVKVYMAKSSQLPAVTQIEELTRIFSAHSLVAIHAEDETRFVPAAQLQDRSHHLQRPREAVISALQKIESALGAVPGRKPRLVICHVSTADEVAWLREVKSRGWDVWGETCPHYLLFDEDDYRREGSSLKVNPPLRTSADVASIRAALRDGTIDFVSSDHAPHSPEEKSREADAPSGIPGIEWSMPLLLKLVDDRLLTWPRLVEVACKAPARCFGLAQRGPIADGNWADLVFLTRTAKPSSRPVLSRAEYNPYSKLELAWEVRAAVVSGVLAYQNGRFFDSGGMEVLA
jgi:dihydroorotase